MDRDCNNCGSSDWTKLVEDDYPESRRERDRTVKTVYRCNECDSEGKHFDQQDDGTEQYSGVLR